MVARTSLLFLDEHWRMPPHQDVELVAGSYGTQRDAELAGGGLHFDPSPAYVSGGESRKKLQPAGRHPTRRGWNGTWNRWPKIKIGFYSYIRPARAQLVVWCV